MKFAVDSPKAMQKFGEMLGQTAKAHDLLLLNGDLGAGKTTLTQGIGRALGIRRPVKSPTFTIVREYREASLPLFHMDFYRLENDDLASIDLMGYLNEAGLVVIEWPQLIMSDLPRHYLQLTLTRVDDSWKSTKRVVDCQAIGMRAKEWLKKAWSEYHVQTSKNKAS